MNNTENKIVVFLDSVGRTILGEKINSDDNTLGIKNPAVIHIMPNQQTGQLQLQILPLFFKEFLADKDAGTVWTYNKKTLTEATDIVLDFKIEAQYKQIFAPGTWHSAPAPQQAPSQQSQSSPEVVKLFDE
jgi:hypothetical protein